MHHGLGGMDASALTSSLGEFPDY